MLRIPQERGARPTEQLKSSPPHPLVHVHIPIPLLTGAPRLPLPPRPIIFSAAHLPHAALPARRLISTSQSPFRASALPHPQPLNQTHTHTHTHIFLCLLGRLCTHHPESHTHTHTHTFANSRIRDSATKQRANTYTQRSNNLHMPIHTLVNRP